MLHFYVDDTILTTTKKSVSPNWETKLGHFHWKLPSDMNSLALLLSSYQQPLLERFLNRAAEGFQNLFTAVEDHFELCLAKCRTSSQVSVIRSKCLGFSLFVAFQTT